MRIELLLLLPEPLEPPMLLMGGGGIRISTAFTQVTGVGYHAEKRLFKGGINLSAEARSPHKVEGESAFL